MNQQSSLDVIALAQSRWAQDLSIPLERDGYVSRLGDNLFLGRLNPETRAEFESADGGELNDEGRRPAKMRALISSSALAVNFFDAWRRDPNEPLRLALGLGEPIARLRFEYKCTDYPIGPRSPNLDVMLTTSSGRRIAIESKFLESYRNPGKRALLSEKYFPPGLGVWSAARLPRAQALVNDKGVSWRYLDAPQLLKHLLGLRSDKSSGEVELLYLWYDTGLDDAVAHRAEIERFAAIVEEENAEEAVRFRSMTYQELFGALVLSEAALPSGWATYMSRRYFQPQ
jgi:hypothetical protein